MQVKERRQLRDQQVKQRLESQLLLREAQREAEEVVRTEERLARERASREEKLLDQQIKLVRRELREKQETSRRLAAEQRAKEASVKEASKRKKREPRSSNAEAIEEDSVLLKAEEIVESEKKRQRTRSELLRQLEEAETREARDAVKLTHRCFSAWCEAVMEQRARLRKVVVVREWRTMVGAWGAWRRWVLQSRAKREAERTTREMQRVKRYGTYLMGQTPNKGRILCYSSSSFLTSEKRTTSPQKCPC